jgi:hypothetical protein
MSGVVAAGGAASTIAAAQAAIAQAIKASGAIVKVSPSDFQVILNRQEGALVLIAPGNIFQPGRKYLTSYKGLAFFTRSVHPIELPGDCEVIQAQKIWVP